LEVTILLVTPILFFAQNNTITGSIGVLNNTTSSQLTTKLGIHTEQVKTHENF
jgi:protease-4